MLHRQESSAPKTMRHGLSIHDVVARERHLRRRAAALKLLATLMGAASAIASAATFVWTRDAIAALVAASPLALVVIAAGWASVTDDQLRRHRLLVAALGAEVAPPPPQRLRCPSAHSRSVRGRIPQRDSRAATSAE